MKQLLLWLVVFILLTGCNNPIKDAKADRIRQQTRRINDRHQIEMKQRRATLPDRIAAEQTLIVFATIGLIGLMGVGLYWAYGYARADIKRRYFMATLIPLDPVTRQYPLLPYEGASGKLRVFNANNDRVRALDQDTKIDYRLADNSAKVQLAGVLKDNDSLIVRDNN